MKSSESKQKQKQKYARKNKDKKKGTSDTERKLRESCDIKHNARKNIKETGGQLKKYFNTLK